MPGYFSKAYRGSPWPQRKRPPSGTAAGTIPPLPTVITVGSSAVTSSATTIVGSVNPNGFATTWWFAYGTTPILGTTSTITSAGSGTVPLHVQIQVSNLVQGQPLYFALAGQSTGGTVYGATLTVTPVSPSPIPTPFGFPSVTIPHFSYPFTITNDGVEVVQQDSLLDVYGCVRTIVACPVAGCSEIPSFGVPNVTFAQEPISGDSLVAAIESQEQRAEISTTAVLAADGQSWDLSLTVSTAGDPSDEATLTI